MARRTSGATTPAPTPAKASPPAMSGSSTGGLGSLIVDGLTWGSANAIAHRVADAIMGPRVVRVETVASPAPAAAAVPNEATSDECVTQYKAFEDVSFSAV